MSRKPTLPLDPRTLRAVLKRLGQVRYASALLIESALLRRDYAAAANYQAKGEAFSHADADIRKLLAEMLTEARAIERKAKPATPGKRSKQR